MRRSFNPKRLPPAFYISVMRGFLPTIDTLQLPVITRSRDLRPFTFASVQ